MSNYTDQIQKQFDAVVKNAAQLQGTQISFSKDDLSFREGALTYGAGDGTVIATLRLGYVDSRAANEGAAMTSGGPNYDEGAWLADCIVKYLHSENRGPGADQIVPGDKDRPFDRDFITLNAGFLTVSFPNKQSSVEALASIDAKIRRALVVEECEGAMHELVGRIAATCPEVAVPMHTAAILNELLDRVELTRDKVLVTVVNAPELVPA